MESAGNTMVEGGEWSTFAGISVNEEADFMIQLFPNNCPLTNSLDDGVLSLGLSTSHESDIRVAGVESGSFYSGDSNDSSNLYCFSQGTNTSSCYSGASGGGSFVHPYHENYYMSDPHQFLAAYNGSLPIDFGLHDAKNFIPGLVGNAVEGDDNLNRQTSCGNLEETFLSEIEPAVEDSSNNPSEIGRKRSRTLDVNKIIKGKRNVRSKRNQKLESDDEDNCRVLHRQNSRSSCISEDDSYASQELSLSSKGTVAATSNGQTRASRGSATDPQSLYARKRRERINERLKILQNLVPNGTKVDISTMLEEAVQYVKFLQLQIKLLSSDDLWMYAPLAYNGMDIGLDLKINIPR